MNKVKKHILISILILINFTFVCSQDKVDLPRFVKTWKIIDKFATVDSIPVDTAHINFQDNNYIDRFSIANSYNGNLGSPIQSKIFADRPQKSVFIFSDAYFPYIDQIESTTFYNSKTPFSSLKYQSGGTKYFKEEDFKFLFTANANKKLNIGTTIDYLLARGEYENQSVKRFAGSLFGSYNGKHYSSTGLLSTNSLSNYENGGLTNPLFITNPPIGTSSQNLQTNIIGYANYKKTQFFYNQQYTLGIERQIKGSVDSTKTEYIPITRFTHTFQFDDVRKRYYEPSIEKDFYLNTYNLKATNDTAALQTFTNRFSASMAEEFNNWLQFGMTAYLENEIERFTFKTDSLINHKVESNVKLGGILSKEQGNQFRYKILGEVNLIGYKIGDFLLNATIGGTFNLWNDKISLNANGFIRSDEPSYFLQHYHSNHFKWDNDFSKIYRTHIGGVFSIPTRSFSLKVDVENITKAIYFDSLALPTQFKGNIQVISANMKLDFHIGKFTLENNFIYQLSSKPTILPLPTLSMYNNLYFHNKWFKVLSVQFGANFRYHTAYYAPAYMPAIGQFHSQAKELIGNFPVMNLYANFHLKRTRYFIEYYHINQKFMKSAYFSMPNYPIDPAIVKMGLSWNFYD